MSWMYLSRWTVNTHRQSTIIALLQLGILSLSRLVGSAPADISALEEALGRDSSINIAVGASEPPLRFGRAAYAPSECGSPVVGDDAGSRFRVSMRIGLSERFSFGRLISRAGSSLHTNGTALVVADVDGPVGDLVLRCGGSELSLRLR